MTKIIIFSMHSDARIALTRECKEHLELIHCLKELMVNVGITWEDQLACIAAYCYIQVDGTYTAPELDKLCEVLLFELKQKRLVNVDDCAAPKIILPN